ncbi:MAG: hypothetical protein FWF44_09450, partial [Defluviitaleaceae bacterium]|nr:hypothetical protein [Defluviitaleaceae bacterium]
VIDMVLPPFFSELIISDFDGVIKSDMRVFIFMRLSRFSGAIFNHDKRMIVFLHNAVLVGAHSVRPRSAIHKNVYPQILHSFGRTLCAPTIIIYLMCDLFIHAFGAIFRHDFQPRQTHNCIFAQCGSRRGAQCAPEVSGSQKCLPANFALFRAHAVRPYNHHLFIVRFVYSCVCRDFQQKSVAFFAGLC